jgi:hypothetical protein
MKFASDVLVVMKPNRCKIILSSMGVMASLSFDDPPRLNVLKEP